MSDTTIKTKNQNILWAISAGRCEFAGCNKVLHTDILTKRNCNSAYIAHIVADKPNGPRGDTLHSATLANDINNLMLLCDTHHRMVDSDTSTYTETCLKSMKKAHEDRIRRITDIAPDMSREIILYGANIGNHNSPLSYQVACEALLNQNNYPASDNAIEIGVVNSILTDDNESYWTIEESNLVDQFTQKLKAKLMRCKTDHYAVFALAPQPLLIKLGTLLNDINEVDVYQKHREPSTWQWQQPSSNIEYVFNEPDDKSHTPVLILSLSATIKADRIRKVLGDDVSIWELSIHDPNSNFLQTQAILSAFKCQMRRVFDKIKLSHGLVELQIFPAMPVSAAVELGRVWMPKVDMPMVIYDANKMKKDFYKTITIK